MIFLVNLLAFTIIGYFNGIVLSGPHVHKLYRQNSIPLENRQLISLREAFITNHFVKRFNGTWISDTEYYYYGPLSNADLNIFNVESLKKQKLISNSVPDQWPGGIITLSPDRKKLLVAYRQETVFRHSTIAKYDVYDIENNTTEHVANGKKLQYCIWSPTFDNLAYVHDNNVYVQQSNGKDIQLTTNGETGIFYNGVPDWVYEEEVLESGGAIWFSPDGTKLAIGVFNDEKVRTYSYVIYGEEDNQIDYQYPKEMHLKYPKPGTNNPKVQLKVVNLNDINKTWVVLEPPVQTISSDYILQSVTWSNNENLIVTWLNRRQNKASIQQCDIKGKCREVIKMEEPNGWIMASDLKCLSNGKSCLLLNWIDNWFQIWNLDLQSGRNLMNSLGQNMTVLKLYGYKESTNEVFYQATLPSDMNQFHVFKNNECLSCNVIDPDGNTCRQAVATFSKNFSYYALTCQGPTTVPFSKLYETKTGKEIINWELNEGIKSFLQRRYLPNVKFIHLPLDSNGNYALVKILLPPNVNLNDENPKHKYPLVVSVYGGPNSVKVNNAFSTGWDTYLVTNRNVIYAYIDGRGTGNKGKSILYQVNNQLGKYEIDDQIRAVQLLQKLYPIIDSERTGIWGWSYGGYVTAMTMAKDVNRIFKCGISVAPVTSWLYYDSIYTERYMGLPTKDDNLLNYNLSDVTRNVSNFRYHEYLLIHGTGDDNVHYQQSMQLAKALQHHDILFEQMSYPDEDHSLGGTTTHLYDTMEHFWNNCLNLDKIDSKK